MKRGLILFALVLFLVPVAMAAVPESFEDDVDGDPPTDGRYSFQNEGTQVGAVTATGVSGNGFGTNGLASGAGDSASSFHWEAENLCAEGAAYSFYFKAGSSSEADNWPLVAFRDENDRGFAIAMRHTVVTSEDRAEIRHIPSFSTLYPDHGGSGISSGALLSNFTNRWVAIQISNVDCTVADQFTYDFLAVNDASEEVYNFTTTVSGGGYTGTGSDMDEVFHGFKRGGRGELILAAQYDDMQWGPISETEAAESPLAPGGVSAFVRRASDGVTSAEVVLRWTVSSNDPDQDVGAFNYFVVPNGFVSIEDDDVVTGADANGQREHVYTTTAEGDFVFTVRAQNATTGLYSSQSCAVLLDLSVLFDESACGVNAPSTTGIGGGDAIIPGVDVNQVADDLGVDRTAFSWVMGAAITFGIAAMAYGGTQSPMLAGAGAVFGVAISTAFGLFPLWLILILVLFGAAAVFLKRG